MVSNDDLDFSRRQKNLHPIINASANTTQWSYNATVPTGKQWRLIGVKMEQTGSFKMIISIHESITTSIDMHIDTAVETLYQPKLDVFLPENWYVRMWFQYDVTPRHMYIKLLYEEETLY